MRYLFAQQTDTGSFGYVGIEASFIARSPTEGRPVCPQAEFILPMTLSCSWAAAEWAGGFAAVGTAPVRQVGSDERRGGARAMAGRCQRQPYPV